MGIAAKEFDPEEDDMLLECCRAAHTGILITGDKDLRSREGIPFRLTLGR